MADHRILSHSALEFTPPYCPHFSQSARVEVGLLIDGSSTFSDISLGLEDVLLPMIQEINQWSYQNIFFSHAFFSDYPLPLFGVGDYGGLDNFYQRDYCYQRGSSLHPVNSGEVERADFHLEAREARMASGGDWKQSVFEGIRGFINDPEVKWSPESPKLLILVTDALPHREEGLESIITMYNETWMRPEFEEYSPQWYLDARTRYCASPRAASLHKNHLIVAKDSTFEHDVKSHRHSDSYKRIRSNPNGMRCCKPAAHGLSI
eukprot:GHVH01000621.1.p1 GENE.GHVH01000621.1~~GHVH01000621.1.p1  ORF type:complete len:263 (-),score=41.75 GHVH01000621.1:13-801(-)